MSYPLLIGIAILGIVGTVWYQRSSASVPPTEEWFPPGNCTVRERTADGVSVGRCMFFCPKGICPRHGDVRAQITHWRQTGELSEDPRFENPTFH